MPLSRTTRALVAIAAVSFPVIVVAYLVAPPDHWARALVYGAAAVLVVVGTLLLARFAHSLRVDRRYADLWRTRSRTRPVRSWTRSPPPRMPSAISGWSWTPS